MGEQARNVANALTATGGETFVKDSAGSYAEAWVHNAVQWLRLGVETMGAIVIGIGILVALLYFASALLSRKPANFNAIRLKFARYLALALEFQLGADILSTAVAPNWGDIGRLAAVAIIRTALNYFLSREIKEETERIDRGETDSSLTPALSSPAATTPS